MKLNAFPYRLYLSVGIGTLETVLVGDHAKAVLRLAEGRGHIGPADVERAGIPRAYLSRLEKSGHLVRIARGIYRQPNVGPTEHHSLVQVAAVNRKAVICLLSALAFHNIGTQNPFEVWVALPKGARTTKFSVRTRVVHLSPKIYTAGIEKHLIEGVEVQVYSVAKTVVDCFRFRSRLGLDVALEALKESLRANRTTISELRQFAEPARMTRVMQPYLEAI
jgi:predicted transcriptional regulator of viral defense system